MALRFEDFDGYIYASSAFTAITGPPEAGRLEPPHFSGNEHYN